MTNREAAGGSDISRDPEEDANSRAAREPGENQPGIVASVGSGALGSVDIEPEEVEPERTHHPDNDGETVTE